MTLLKKPRFVYFRIKMDKEKLMKMASSAYYLNSNMIKFLLIENLALKNLLHEKGLITVEEYQQSKKIADDILTSKEQEQILNYFKSVMESSTASLA